MDPDQSLWDRGHRDLGRPLIIAHRGASAVAPENTAEAFRAARRLGADAFETDVRLTADLVPVCAHDATLGGGSIRDLAHAALRAGFPALTTLRDACAIGLAIYIDLKEGALDRIIGLLDDGYAAHGARWIVGVTSIGQAQALKARFPRLRQVGLMNDAPAIEAYAAAYPGSWIRVHEPRATPVLLGRLRDRGMRIMVTCGTGDRPVGAIDAAQLARLAALAPDAVILNDPGLAQAMFSRPGR